MFTAYFDTSFYVLLARADAADAARIVAALNAFDVRCVLSGTLLAELGSSADRPDADRALHARVSELAAAPYCTAAGLSWDELLLEGESRRSGAQALVELDRALVEARSMQVVANPDFPHGLRDATVEHVVAESPFLNADGTPDMAALEAFFVPIAASVGVMLSVPLAAEDFPRISAAIFARLEEMGVLEPANTARRLLASAARDSRPYEVVLGTATPKSKRKLANAFRDGAHMAEFVAHSHAIDVLQIDGPQHRQLTENPQHELRRLGLDGRCFTAPTALDAVARVIEFCHVRESGTAR